MKNKLNIEEIKLLIPDYITGFLSEEENKKVKDAIDNSSELKELYVDLKNALEFTNSVKLEEPAPQYWNNLLPKIHQKIDEREQQRLAKNPLSYIWKILAPVAVVILIFIIYEISFVSEPDITKTGDKNFKQEITISKDSVKNDLKPVEKKDNTELQFTKDNNVKKIKRIKKTDTDTYTPNTENKKDNKEILTEVKDEYASIAVDELTIFGAGAPGVFDEETDIELDKLNDSEREEFLEELNNNL